MDQETATEPKLTKPATVEVQVRRVERFACGCTTTRISEARVAAKWLLKCSGHGGPLASVETTMEYELGSSKFPPSKKRKKAAKK